MNHNRWFVLLILTFGLLIWTQSGNAFDKSSTGQHGSNKRLSTNEDITPFIPPKVVIDGTPMEESIFISAIKMKCLGIASIHGPQPYDVMAPLYWREVLETMIGRELLVREGIKNGIKVPEPEFNQHFQTTLTNLGGGNKVESFFSSMDLSIDQYRQLSYHAYQARKYVEKMVSDTPITNNIIQEYYRENIIRFSGAEKRHFSFVKMRFLKKEPSNFTADSLESAAMTIKTRSELAAFAEKMKGQYGSKVDLTAVYESNLDRGAGLSAWLYNQLEGKKAGQTVYYSVEDDAKIFHFIQLLEKVEPRPGPGFEKVRSAVESELQSKWPGLRAEAEVARLKSKSQIEVSYPQ